MIFLSVSKKSLSQQTWDTQYHVDHSCPKFVILLSLSASWETQQNFMDSPKNPNHRVIIHWSICCPGAVIWCSFFFLSISKSSFNHYQPLSKTTQHGSHAHTPLLMTFTCRRERNLWCKITHIQWIDLAPQMTYKLNRERVSVCGNHSSSNLKDTFLESAAWIYIMLNLHYLLTFWH